MVHIWMSHSNPSLEAPPNIAEFLEGFVPPGDAAPTA